MEPFPCVCVLQLIICNKSTQIISVVVVCLFFFFNYSRISLIKQVQEQSL